MANTNKLSISNNALVLIGAEQIQSFDDDVVEAEVIKNIYEPTLRTLLSGYDWDFAKEIKQLNQLANTDEVYGYKYSYTMPHDYLSCRNSLENERFEIFKNIVYSNEADFKMTYIARVDENQFTQSFIECFTNLLASKIAVPIMENVTLVEMFNTLYTNTYKLARKEDTQSTTSKFVKSVMSIPYNLKG